MTHQVTSASLQPLSDQEPSTDSLQTNDEGFTAPPEDAAAVRARNTTDHLLQRHHTHDITAADQSQARRQNLSLKLNRRNIKTVLRPLTPGVSHLYVVSVQEHTVLYEAARFVPAALQSVQVEEVE